jgi:glycosyltransferase involved in cell wall biosynthesis
VRWLVFGTYDVRRHPRVGVLIEGLRDAGDEVTEVNVPLELDTAARVAMLRQPWRLPVLAVKLLRCWTLLALRAWRHRGPEIDAVLVGYLGHFDVRLARRVFRRTPIVLDHLVSAAGTARDRGLAFGGGLKARLMRSIDAGALRRADVIVVDTAEHAAALPAEAAERGVVAPVGAGAAWFAVGRAAPAPVAGQPLRVIFVGLFTPLHGTETIGAALAALAADERVEVTMVGTGQDYAVCRAAAAGNPRVTWLDWVAGEELPALVAGHDVSLGIFGTTDKARNVVPTKVFQGAAAGCAVVTSDTPPQRQALGDAALFVPPGDAAALAAALSDLAARPDRLARLRAAAADRATERFAPATVVAAVRERVGTPWRPVSGAAPDPAPTDRAAETTG